MGTGRQLCSVVVVVADAAWYHETTWESGNDSYLHLEPKWKARPGGGCHGSSCPLPVLSVGWHRGDRLAL